MCERFRAQKLETTADALKTAQVSVQNELLTEQIEFLQGLLEAAGRDSTAASAAGGRKAQARKRKSANADEETDKRRKRGSAAALQPLGGGLPADGGTKRKEQRQEKKHAGFIASPYDTKTVSFDDQGKIRKGDAALYYRRFGGVAPAKGSGY